MCVSVCVRVWVRACVRMWVCVSMWVATIIGVFNFWIVIGVGIIYLTYSTKGVHILFDKIIWWVISCYYFNLKTKNVVNFCLIIVYSSIPQKGPKENKKILNLESWSVPIHDTGSSYESVKLNDFMPKVLQNTFFSRFELKVCVRLPWLVTNHCAEFQSSASFGIWIGVK